MKQRSKMHIFILLINVTGSDTSSSHKPQITNRITDHSIGELTDSRHASLVTCLRTTNKKEAMNLNLSRGCWKRHNALYHNGLTARKHKQSSLRRKVEKDPMANLFTEQENVRLHVPSQILRQRLKSAPEKLLQSPMMAKTLTTPLPSGRRAFGAVNKKILTPVVNAQEKKLLKPQETKVKLPPLQIKVEEYPEKELFIPYDPLEFERYSVPEDTVPLSCFALPGLACFTQTLPNLDEEKLEELPNFSPVKMPESTDDCQELAAFLQTLDELTELPSESEF